MKRIIALGLFLIFFASGAFAMDMAVGGGLMYNYSNSFGVYKETIYGDTWREALSISRNGFGGFVFFGVGRYLELNFGTMYKSPKTLGFSIKYAGEKIYEEKEDITSLDGAPALQFGAYFKVPFVVSDHLVFFPTVGLDYELTLAEKYEGWWDDLWIRGGLGFDIFFTERLFLRSHFIYGFGIMIGKDDSVFYYAGYATSQDSNYSHGFLMKFGLGFMF